jgi:hypothetical protein
MEPRKIVQRKARWLVFWIVTVLDCQRVAAPVPAIQASLDQARSVDAVPALVTATKVATPPMSPDHGDLHTPDGRPWSGAERVDADVIRVKTLIALFVEANEIRCPHVIQSKSVPIQKDIAPWQVEGDLVETDVLVAHSVAARLIVADEVRAEVIRTLTTPHRWRGIGGPSQVRNRVTHIEALMVPKEDPVF